MIEQQEQQEQQERWREQRKEEEAEEEMQSSTNHHVRSRQSQRDNGALERRRSTIISNRIGAVVVVVVVVVVVHLVLLMGMTTTTTKTTTTTARVLPNDNNDSFWIPFAVVSALHILDATTIRKSGRQGRFLPLRLPIVQRKTTIHPPNPYPVRTTTTTTSRHSQSAQPTNSDLSSWLSWPQFFLPNKELDDTAVSSSSSSSVTTTTNAQPHAIVLPLLLAAAQPQSTSNRQVVETWIDQVTRKACDCDATKNEKGLRRPLTPGTCSRLVWSTVTSNSLLGTMFQKRPSNVLGGPSWQVLSCDMTRVENIVYWTHWNHLCMVGLARLLPLSLDGGSSQGYGVEICGLEFRWGAGGHCPEQQQQQSLPKQQQQQHKPSLLQQHTNNDDDNHDTKRHGHTSWQVFALDESQTLGNGVGELQVLYNDGVVRITRDVMLQNTYIHVQESSLSLEWYQLLFDDNE